MRWTSQNDLSLGHTPHTIGGGGGVKVGPKVLISNVKIKEFLFSEYKS